MSVGKVAKHVAVAAIGALVLGAASSNVMAQSGHEHGQDQRKAAGLVKAVREATERYRDVAIAEADGYGSLFGCVSGPDYGAMGLHYVNAKLVFDNGELDVNKPEIIIYEPTANGRLRITGADYLVIAEEWDKKHPKNPPELMGQLFHRFDAPNRFGLPAFYTLHVWAWKDNPTGMFSNWHANVSCDLFPGQN